MTFEDWQREPWFAATEGVPTELQLPLQLFGGAKSHFDITASLAEQLGLQIRNAGYETWYAVFCLVDPLAESYREGSKFLELQPIHIARSAVRALDLSEAARTMTDLGWGRTQLKQPAIQDLEDAVRAQLARRLEPFISKMMDRWEQRGIRRPRSKAS